MRYAEVRDGRVVQVISLPEGATIEGAVRAELLSSFYPASAEVEVGWARSDAGFTPPTVPLPPAVDLVALASELRWRQEVSGIVVMIGGEAVPVSTARGDDRAALHMTYSAIRDGLRRDGATFNFADGRPRSVANADMEAAILAALNHVQGAFDLGGEVIAAVEAGTITTAEAVRAAFEG